MKLTKTFDKFIFEVDRSECLTQSMMMDIMRKIDDSIVEQFTADFIKEHRKDILKKVDFKAIANAVGVKLVDKIMSNNK